MIAAPAAGGRVAPARKSVHVRHHVLERIEAGTWPVGGALPGARDLAGELGISFLTVQQALESLAADGVLELRPRIGTFVRAGWQDRVLRDNLSVFNLRRHLPWIDGLSAILAREMPDLRLTDAFPRGVLEIKTLLHAQQHHDHYLDLSGVVDAAVAASGPVYTAPFAPCRVDGRLIGVPVIASPRVVCFNPGLLRRHGCALPAPGWTWDDLMATVRRLAGVMDPGLIVDWATLPHCWLNIVRRAGGALFTGDDRDPIALDRPETRHGLRLCRELADALGRCGHDQGRFTDAFAASEAALALAPRQFMSALRQRGADGWDVAPLPAIPGGADTSGMAADLVCVRDTCTDPQLAARFVALMLSPAVQDHLAGLGYGIQMRKASAMQAIDLADPRELRILAEMERTSAEPCQASADLARFVINGVTRILDESDDIDRDALELARAARLHAAVGRHVPVAQRPRQEVAP